MVLTTIQTYEERRSNAMLFNQNVWRGNVKFFVRAAIYFFRRFGINQVKEFRDPRAIDESLPPKTFTRNSQQTMNQSFNRFSKPKKLASPSFHGNIDVIIITIHPLSTPSHHPCVRGPDKTVVCRQPIR
ncbi:hypothetical protein JTE90_000271 [Oedothorax gibbosus]|uniref:Uncharacterized protein n=1 Tax=Oedothorax gibbosus TaxID=931172 RepID=A0AAV6VTN6_9ARAC|nr:hypothetical protein JTE90_000271 [Oedothorax gibbosus]